MDHDHIKNSLRGPVPSIRTPFNRDGSIDFSSLRNMVEFDIAAGSKSLVITWGDSLFCVLTEQEIAEITKTVVDQARGRATVVACTSLWNTSKCVEFARYAKSVGADILMLLGSNWYPECVTVDSMVEHHAAVAQHMPVMANTGNFKVLGMAGGLEAAKRLMSETENVISAKCDVSGEFDRKVVLHTKEKWSVFSGGSKQFHMELHPYGCQGHMTTFMTFRPQVAHDYWNAIQRNDLAAAVRIIETVDYPFFDFISALPGGFDAGMHGAMEIFGLGQRWRRKPFVSLPDPEMERLREFFRGLKLL